MRCAERPSVHNTHRQALCIVCSRSCCCLRSVPVASLSEHLLIRPGSTCCSNNISATVCGDPVCRQCAACCVCEHQARLFPHLHSFERCGWSLCIAGSTEVPPGHLRGVVGILRACGVIDILYLYPTHGDRGCVVAHVSASLAQTKGRDGWSGGGARCSEDPRLLMLPVSCSGSGG